MDTAIESGGRAGGAGLSIKSTCVVSAEAPGVKDACAEQGRAVSFALDNNRVHGMIKQTLDVVRGINNKPHPCAR